MRLIARLVSPIASALIALCVVGCFQRLNLKDFEHLPVQQPLHRYAIAHRGSLHTGQPDNSIPALKEAISKGVKFLEVDVRRSKDGELFLFHDSSLQRSNYSLPRELLGRKVQQLSGEERAQVRLDPQGAVGIPTLREALRVVMMSADATLQIDMKGESDELLDSVLTVVKEEGALQRALIQLKNPARIQRIRVQKPHARIVARVKTMEQLEQAIAARVEFVELERWVTAEAVAKAHAAKIPVVLNVAAPPYDSAETWNLFRSKGVDSIMTDHADRAQ